MFISTSERLCAICVWLDWIDLWNFILDYGLVHTWFTHTTLKTNVQWMPISFMWLYVFKCDLCILNCLMIKPKMIFKYFIWFWMCFCVSLVFWDFFQKSKYVLLKNSFRGIFASKSQEKLSRSLTAKMRKLIFISSKILHRDFRNSLTTTSQDPHNYFARNSFPRNLSYAFEAFHEYPMSTTWGSIPWKKQIFGF